MERGHDAVLAEARAGLGLVRATSFEERVLIAAQSVSAAGRALRPASDRARERVQGGQPIIRHQLIQAVPADSATDLAVSRVLVYQVAWESGPGGDPRTLDAQVAMAKVSATEPAGRVVDRRVQTFGGRGYVRDNPVEHLCHDARVDRIRMGTSEVQALMVADEIDERGLSGPLRFATAPAGEGEPHTPRGPHVEGAAR
ncbi:acyl-CoA dehydrogenase family protein [Streptomyces europaeiscabiei]|uniref:acyl-CoA dehydrogenase family protein n=1 Tax=Streptomyces europaeiscabiei TaxID=146819 RepID=UPI0029B8D0F9|nr:acyl-CoA dehydrogenase family protein [Streptomyces europaeiscabiei]MDX3695856.1 acyl-CoA dehydrogenase family protein [Streptomyces europaeiscabiei]